MSGSRTGWPGPPVAYHMVQASGYSFPSDRATAAITVWGAVAVVVSAGMGVKGKVAVWGVSASIVILVASSGVYLGVNWWTDVAGGLALGGAWLCVLLIGGLLLSETTTARRSGSLVSSGAFGAA